MLQAGVRLLPALGLTNICKSFKVGDPPIQPVCVRMYDRRTVYRSDLDRSTMIRDKIISRANDKSTRSISYHRLLVQGIVRVLTHDQIMRVM